MKKILILLAVTVLSLTIFSTAYADDILAQSASGRAEEAVQSLCEGWRFGGNGLSSSVAASASYNDASWQSVSLPHTWNAFDAQDGGSNYLRTAYWYRKSLAWQTAFEGKKIYIEFLGANQKTDLYVNGTHIPYNGSSSYTHQGGYTAFRFDVTKYLTKGTNTLAVCVDNTRDEAIAPISADFNMYGGIYRRVFLVMTDNVHVDMNDNGSSGLYLTTPNVRSMERPENLGELNIKAKIVNDSSVTKTVTVTASVEGDNAPSPVSATLTIAPNGTAQFDKTVFVTNPHLWQGIDYSENASGDVGYRYDVKLSISEGTNVIDEVSDKVGFRYFYVDNETGFYLNGESHPLRGVCRHQSMRDKGNALLETDHDRDMEIMMEMGVNAIRLSHYPQTDYFYDLCDENGIVTWSEIPFVNQLGTSQNFASVTKNQLVEMIRQQYNRASVCFWGLENEVGNGATSNNYIKMKELVNQLDNLALSEDSSGRYTTQAINRDYAMDQMGGANFNDFTNNTGWKSDIVAWNIYPGWYNDSNFTGTFADVMDRKKALESRPMGISEYGWGANANQHEEYPALNKNGLTAGGSWHPEEYQSINHEDAMKYINEHDELWGTFVWNMFDFAVDGRNEGSQIALNDKGLVTDDRNTKKDSFYLYKANWNIADKFVRLTSSRFTTRDSSVTYVKAYSNCDSVKLLINGVDRGEMESLGNGVFQLDNIALAIGTNNIKVVGTYNGAEYVDEAAWTRAISSVTNLSSDIFAIDNDKKSVLMDEGMTLSEFLNSVTGVNNSTYKIFDASSEITEADAVVLPGMRIVVTAEDGVTSASYSIVAANLCVKKNVTVSSFETGNVKENAVDANSSTRWTASNNSYPQNICVDLGAEYFLGNLTIEWYDSSSRYYKYNVEVSTDGLNFECVLDRSNNTTVGSVTDSLRLRRGRYLRINVTGCSASSGYAAIYEIKQNGWMISSDTFTIDHQNRLIIVPENVLEAGIIPQAFDEQIQIIGNCAYEIQCATGYITDGNCVEITDSDGQKITYYICTNSTRGDKLTNVALYKDTFYSTEEGISTDGTKTLADNINDNNTKSRWASETNGGTVAKYPEWVGIDLGYECVLSDIELYFETKGSRVYTYQVFASNSVCPQNGADFNAVGYEMIADRSNNTEAGGHYTIDVSGKRARYIVVKVLSCDKWSSSTPYVAPSIYEMIVMGRGINDDISISDFKVENGKMAYSLTAGDDFNTEACDVFAAIYDKAGALAKIFRNVFSTENIEVSPNEEYLFKVMVWNKSTMIPYSNIIKMA